MSKRKILLDTNFLLTTIRYKLHGLSQIKEKIPSDFYVLSGTIDELEGLARNDKKIAKEYKLVQEMLHNNNAIGIKSSTENVDNELVELCKEYIIATNDKELRNRIKKAGGKSIFIKKLAYVEMGEIL